MGIREGVNTPIDFQIHPKKENPNAKANYSIVRHEGSKSEIKR